MCPSSAMHVVRRDDPHESKALFAAAQPARGPVNTSTAFALFKTWKL
jgi:hypothetical protein